MHSVGFALVLTFFDAASSSAREGVDVAVRPAPCRALEGERGENVWERAKDPGLRAYCDLLASATSKLVGSAPLASDVLGIVEEAERRMPGFAAPQVLKGRALLRLGKAEAARSALAEAKRRDVRAFDDPAVLLAWARANARTGQIAEAASAYRVALPRSSLLAPEERAAVAFEGGMAAMALGPEHIDDAVAILRQARRDADDALSIPSAAAMALALDRAGLRDEARALVVERFHGALTQRLRDASLASALASCGRSHELDALVAVALEPTDPTAAREAWKRFEAKAEGPWLAHARSKLAGGVAKRTDKSEGRAR